MPSSHPKLPDLPAGLVSFVVPVYNEAPNLRLFLREISAVANAIPYRYEILIINDGSTDGSTELLQELTKSNSHVSHIEFSRNFGKEYATTAGLHAAKGDAAICLDSDFQHPLSLIPEFLLRWKKGAEVVIGVRNKSKSDGLIKRLGSSLFYKIMNVISETEIVPHSTDFRLIDRKVIDQFNLLTEKGRLTRGLIDWLGFKREYIYFDANERRSGKSTYSVSGLFELAINSFLIFSLLPLRLTMYLGLAITLASGLLGTVMMVALIRPDGGLVFTGPAMLADIILFLVGILLISQGFLAFYIGQIYREVQNRPLYIIKNISPFPDTHISHLQGTGGSITKDTEE